MHARSLLAVTTISTLSAALLGCSTITPPPAAASVATAPARKAPSDRHVHRLDVVLSSNEPGKSASESTYSLNLEEDRGGDIRLGANVALSQQARQDVGLKLSMSYTMVGDDLLLHSGLEMSSFEEPSTVHKIAGDGDALIAPGKPALVTSIEDPLGHKRYELKVTATKLR